MTKDNLPGNRTPEFMFSSKGLGLQSFDSLLNAFSSISVQDYIMKHGDIPRQLTINGKNYPIDRYLREKLYDALQITEKVKELRQEKYSQDMQDLLIRAKETGNFPEHWFKDEKKIGWILQDQMLAERSQALKNFEAKTALFTKEKTNA